MQLKQKHNSILLSFGFAIAAFLVMVGGFVVPTKSAEAAYDFEVTCPGTIESINGGEGYGTIDIYQYGSDEDEISIWVESIQPSSPALTVYITNDYGKGNFSANATVSGAQLGYYYTVNITAYGNLSRMRKSCSFDVEYVNTQTTPSASIECNSNGSPCDIYSGDSAEINYIGYNIDFCEVRDPNGTVIDTAYQYSGDNTGYQTIYMGPYINNGQSMISYTYTLYCQRNYSLTYYGSATVNVWPEAVQGPNPTGEIYCNSAASCTISSGSSATISWSSLDATGCYATNNGDQTWYTTSGSQSTGARTTGTTYYLYCYNQTSGGYLYLGSADVLIGAPPTTPSGSINCNGASGCTIYSGQSATINWSSSNSPYCYVTSNNGTWYGTSGSQSTGALYGYMAYTLYCADASYNYYNLGSVGVNVTSPPVTPTGSITCNSSSSCSIYQGQSATISWSSSNSPSCYVNHPGGTWYGTSGGQSTGALYSNTSYPLYCWDSAHSYAYYLGTATVYVSAPPVPPTGNIYCNGSTNCTIYTGQSATISWSTSNSPSCAVYHSNGSWSGTSGSQSTGSLTSSGSYSLYCYDNANANFLYLGQANVTVTAPPPTATLTCNGSTSDCTIPYNTSATIGWSSTNTDTCYIYRDGGYVTQGNSGSMTVTLTSTTTFTVNCYYGGYLYYAQLDSLVVNVSPPPPTASITCNGSTSSCTTNYGSAVTIAWSSTNATSCSVTSSPAAVTWTGTSGSQSSGALYANRTYNVTCSGAGGSTTSSVSVTVNIVPTGSILCNGSSSCSIGYNAAATISWTSSNSPSCYVARPSGTWSGTSGSQSTGNLTTNSTYYLYCYTADWSSNYYMGQANVTVQSPPPTASITCNGSASSCSTSTGSAVTIAWSSSNATSCSVTSSPASVTWTGTTGSQSSGALSSNRTYTVSCSGPGGSSSNSVTVNVIAIPTGTLTCNGASTCTIPYNNAATIAWTSTNSPMCYVYTPTITWSGVSGSQSTGALTTNSTYSLYCYNSDYSNYYYISQLTVNVQPSVNITCNGAATSCTVDYGTAVTIAWSSTYATSCNVSPSGWTGTSGSQSTPALYTTTVYTLSCTGAGGSASRTVTVNVNPLPTGSITCNGSSSCTIPYNTAATISWTSANSPSCYVTRPSGTWTGTSGSQSTGSLTTSSSYGLYCYNPSMTSTYYLGQSTITVQAPPPTASITCNGSSSSCSIPYNTEATIDWSSTNTDTCYIYRNGTYTGWNGRSGSSNTGNQTTTSTYSVGCYSGGYATFTTFGSVTVTVLPLPTASITCNGSSSCTINGGTSVTIAWSSTNASSCSVTSSPASVTWTGTSGSQNSGAITNTRTYTASCTGGGGSTSTSLTVYVYPTGNIYCNVSSTECPVAYNESNATVNWSSANSTSCFVSISTGGSWSGTSGARSAGTMTTNTTYSLFCDDSFGSSYYLGGATITVSPPPNPPNTVSASNTVACESVRVTWTASGTPPDGYKVYRRTQGTGTYTDSWNQVGPDIPYIEKSDVSSLPPSGGFWAGDEDTSSDAVFTFDDNAPLSANGSNYYSVASYNGVNYESAKVEASNNPIIPESCNPNITNSDKDLIAVAGQITKDFEPEPCNGTSEIAELYNNAVFVPGDIITFKINVCNTGNGTLENISLKDDMANLEFVKVIDITDVKGQEGTPCATMDSFGDAFANFNLANIPPMPDENGDAEACSITYTTRVIDPGTVEANIYRFQNTAEINADGVSEIIYTPPYLFSPTGREPVRSETTPQI